MTADPNSRQVGGDHYARGGKLQHWDLIENYGIGYLEGYATKYILRWRDKNGVEDLRKADHCVEKLASLSFRGPRGSATQAALQRFVADHALGKYEAFCFVILCGKWDRSDLDEVRTVLKQMIDQEVAAAHGAQGSEPQEQHVPTTDPVRS